MTRRLTIGELPPSGCIECGAESRSECRFPFAGLAGRRRHRACMYPPKPWLDPVKDKATINARFVMTSSEPPAVSDPNDRRRFLFASGGFVPGVRASADEVSMILTPEAMPPELRERWRMLGAEPESPPGPWRVVSYFRVAARAAWAFLRRAVRAS